MTYRILRDCIVGGDGPDRRELAAGEVVVPSGYEEERLVAMLVDFGLAVVEED